MSAIFDLAKGSDSESRRGDEPKGRQRKQSKGSLSISRISSFSEVEGILPEWRELYAVGGRTNPFASPEWLVPWAQHFVNERDLALLAVRRGDLLVGLAPSYFRGGRLLPRRLHLLGSGCHEGLTELPQVLTAPGEARAVLRAVVDEWCQSTQEWDWIQFPTMFEQGWFEPEWLTGEVAGRGLVQHKITRAAVVLNLPADVSELEKRLKPNLRESLRQSRSRLNRVGKPWSVSVHEGGDAFRSALLTFAELHGARSRMGGRRYHPDAFGDPGRMRFLKDVLPTMARVGRAQILSLNIGEVSVAMLLILLAPSSTYFYMSGFDPEWWRLSPVTMLQWHAAKGAVERGHESVNISVGPDVAKLRWTEQIHQHPEFLVCGPGGSSHAMFTAYRMASAVVAVRREARRDRVTEHRKGP